MESIYVWYTVLLCLSPLVTAFPAEMKTFNERETSYLKVRFFDLGREEKSELR